MGQLCLQLCDLGLSIGNALLQLCDMIGSEFNFLAVLLLRPFEPPFVLPKRFPQDLNVLPELPDRFRLFVGGST
eukprot:CAMPEP_0115738692 /NCGR_PEP_ID=MMETSP0272-20121206/88519_1 /TAXON_ID=71861 /ORGANISM="Scrippsiella trochoidea, Strain CCMP3099" /LENGTH=73 /DNA_ID=CAMNT_0003183143 /DNA_START=145 /DNA_END=366 /DNA_ORIENTATION=+